MGRITKRFENGNANIELDSGQLVKLSAGLVHDMMNLIKGHVRGYDAVRVWLRYWKGEQFFIAGPDNEAKKTWDEKPAWEHHPFVDFVSFIELLEILHGKDLSAYKNFMAGEHDLFRGSRVYVDWLRQKQGSGYFNPDTHSKESTVVVDSETWERMTQGDG